MAKPKISFEEMTQISNDWMKNPVGTQSDMFNKNGWSRAKYFNEEHYRRNPDERPVKNKVKDMKVDNLEKLPVSIDVPGSVDISSFPDAYDLIQQARERMENIKKLKAK